MELEENYKLLEELRRTLFPCAGLEKMNFKEFKTFLAVEELFVQSAISSFLIENLDIRKHQKEIIQGMYNPKRIITNGQDFSPLIPKVRAINDMRLKYSYEYVEKWKMYNEIFGERTKYASQCH